jgi:hypothetical protein
MTAARFVRNVTWRSFVGRVYPPTNVGSEFAVGEYTHPTQDNVAKAVSKILRST